jgi:hypothetical protein
MELHKPIEAFTTLTIIRHTRSSGLLCCVSLLKILKEQNLQEEVSSFLEILTIQDHTNSLSPKTPVTHLRWATTQKIKDLNCIVGKPRKLALLLAALKLCVPKSRCYLKIKNVMNLR